MYDIRQFIPSLYVLLILGFTGFALSAESPGLWVLGVGGTIAHLLLYRRSGLKPIPRIVANAITLLAAGWMVLRVRQLSGPPIIAIGEFLVILQLVKLFETRGNRDYAQLLILSLLLMVAAAISTASLLFGIMLVAYLFLSLFCCLLFHLKVEADHARKAMGHEGAEPNPATLRQDQRYLVRSMRRLTVAVSFVSVITAVGVFLLFPRGVGANAIGNIAFKPSQAMTGFSDTLSFQDVARIGQDETIVASVEITKNGQRWGAAGQEIYLRGNAPDRYINDANSVDRWKWVRSPRNDGRPFTTTGDDADFDTGIVPRGTETYRQTIRLEPTGTDVLFAMPGLVNVRPARPGALRFTPSDQVLQSVDKLTQEYRYEVTSTNGLIPVAPRGGFSGAFSRRRPMPEVVGNEKIRTYALRDDVAGTDTNGNLAKRRVEAGEMSDLDAKIAANFVKHFAKDFRYTLDLTDVRKLDDSDPMEQFLYDFKKGHCEYFASAMALMCQSVGINARLVTGFKSDEFNDVGGYYVIRRSHAHAWVEVQTPQGWQTFDPTVGREAEGQTRGSSWWQRVRHFMDFLEFSWGNSVVNYDAESRTNVIEGVDEGMNRAATQSSAWLKSLREWFNEANFFLVSSRLLSLAVWLMALLVIGAIGWFGWERYRKRQMIKRIGIDTLSSMEQKRLARQLTFYDELLRLLEKHKIVRPRHMTPMEFCRSIGFLPSDVYSDVQRLTDVFYRVRYGGGVLDNGRTKRLERVVANVGNLLGASR